MSSDLRLLNFLSNYSFYRIERASFYVIYQFLQQLDKFSAETKDPVVKQTLTSLKTEPIISIPSRLYNLKSYLESYEKTNTKK